MISAQSGIADRISDGISEKVAPGISNHVPPAPVDNRNPSSPNLDTSAPAGPARPASRRRISPASGRALECLGRAIEYLTDEYCLTLGRTGLLEPADPRVEAIQLLMSLNRQIYYACPEIEPVHRRLARWIFRLPAVAGAHSKQPLN